jgi:hypothetical protein
MSSPSSAYALVEDKRHRQFIYRFLVQAGINRNKITVEVSPSGLGSGKQWVCKRFALQTEVCRRRNAKNATCLFAIMDADQLTVARCLGDLDASLIAASQPKLDPAKDPIARLIPKWSIETWILYLTAKGAVRPPISEGKSYKDSQTKEQWSEQVPQAAITLFEWTRATAALPTNLIDSLRYGIEEIPRALLTAR